MSALTLAKLAAATDGGIEVETELVAEVRETVDGTSGRETYRFVPATTLTQGQVIYYTLRIRNPEPVAAANVAVTQRIPVNTSYIAGSASGPGAQITFSTDGGQTFAPANQLRDDKTKREPAPEQYTHIRWQLHNSLAPGAVALARFQAVFK